MHTGHGGEGGEALAVPAPHVLLGRLVDIVGRHQHVVVAHVHERTHLQHRGRDGLTGDYRTAAAVAYSHDHEAAVRETTGCARNKVDPYVVMVVGHDGRGAGGGVG